MSKILYSELLLAAYQQGYFPMADEREGEIFWHSPDPRAIIPLDSAKPPRSLKQFLKKTPLEYKIDAQFKKVVVECANRKETWINDEIIQAYTELHELGFAHCVESYLNNELVGGLYGVTIGGAFFGESMFFKISNASKAAFYHLVKTMKKRGFILLDSQYINYFTESLGAIEIPKERYLKILNRAIHLPCSLK